VGDGATALAALASRLECGRILVGTARKDALARLVEGSLTTRLIERSPVPVEVVAGRDESPWERFGIPAALAGGLVALMAMVDD
jgi:K+-sensing histidine kinase KdpD